MEKITFTFEGEDQAVEFFVLEQTKLGGVTYILVTDSEEDDAESVSYTHLTLPTTERV